MIKIILYTHCKLFKYKKWGSLKKNTIQYSDNKKNEKSK